MLNSYSGKTPKVFNLNQNQCSAKTRIGVHVKPEWVFRLGRNMQHYWWLDDWL